MSDAVKCEAVKSGGDPDALCMFCRCRAGVIGLLPGGFCYSCADYGAVLVIDWEGGR